MHTYVKPPSARFFVFTGRDGIGLGVWLRRASDVGCGVGGGRGRGKGYEGEGEGRVVRV